MSLGTETSEGEAQTGTGFGAGGGLENLHPSPSPFLYSGLSEVGVPAVTGGLTLDYLPHEGVYQWPLPFHGSWVIWLTTADAAPSLSFSSSLSFGFLL